MKGLKTQRIVMLLIICLCSNITKSQVKNSVSIGGGLNHPLYVKGYDPSWFGTIHWNIGLNEQSFIDTHFDLAKIGVKDYDDLPGAENDNSIFQLGIGFRRYFTKSLFARAGLSGAIVNDGEASAKIIPTVSIGYDLLFSHRHGLEFSFKNDFVRNFDYHKQVSILNFGVAYKLWYLKKR